MSENEILECSYVVINFLRYISDDNNMNVREERDKMLNVLSKYNFVESFTSTNANERFINLTIYLSTKYNITPFWKESNSTIHRKDAIDFYRRVIREVKINQISII